MTDKGQSGWCTATLSLVACVYFSQVNSTMAASLYSKGCRPLTSMSGNQQTSLCCYYILVRSSSHLMLSVSLSSLAWLKNSSFELSALKQTLKGLSLLSSTDSLPRLCVLSICAPSTPFRQPVYPP